MNRPIALGVLAVVTWYVLYETGKMLFGNYFSYRVIDWWPRLFMLGLMYGLRSPWPGLFVIGSLCNLFVTTANGGKMPVVGIPKTPHHIAVNAATRFAFLADRWNLGNGESSPGDILMLIGWWGTMIAVLGVVLSSPRDGAPD